MEPFPHLVQRTQPPPEHRLLQIDVLPMAEVLLPVLPMLPVHLPLAACFPRLCLMIWRQAARTHSWQCLAIPSYRRQRRREPLRRLLLLLLAVRLVPTITPR